MMTKKRIVAVCAIIVVAALGMVVAKSTLFRAAEDFGTTTKASPYTLKIAISEEGDDGEYRANFGRIQIIGDCIETDGARSSDTGISGRNGMSCQLVQKPLTGGIARDQDEYLISGVSFDSERQGRIIHLPLGEEDSLSPLRLKKSTTLLFRISRAGTIQLTQTELP